VAPLLAGFTGCAGFHAQRAGALEGVRHGRLQGDPRERSNSPLAEPLDQAGRAVELPRLSAAAEEPVQVFPREVLVIRGHHPSSEGRPRIPRWPKLVLGRRVESVPRHVRVGTPQIERLERPPQSERQEQDPD